MISSAQEALSIAARDVVRLVEGDDGDRNLRHAGNLKVGTAGLRSAS